MTRIRSITTLDYLAAITSTERLIDPRDVDRILEELDGTISEEEVGASRVYASEAKLAHVQIVRIGLPIDRTRRRIVGNPQLRIEPRDSRRQRLGPRDSGDVRRSNRQHCVPDVEDRVGVIGEPRKFADQKGIAQSVMKRTRLNT